MAEHRPLVRTGGKTRRLPAGDKLPIDVFPVGVMDPAGALMTYDSGRLSRIDYDDGSYKLLTYDAGHGYRLQRIDYVHGSATTRKDFIFNLDGSLHEIVQTEL